MSGIGMVLHATRAEAAAAAGALARALTATGMTVVATAADAARIGEPVAPADPLPSDLDLVIAFGGDGTLLHALSLVGPAETPVLGVNLGHLGFLSGAEAGDLDTAAGRLAARDYDIQDRRMLRAVADGQEWYALNDVIVEKRRAGRSIRLAVAVGDEPLVSWAADGIIVASATGSTAYSFSVGGPVVSPRIDCMLVTPVAAHGTFGRSLVVPPDEDVAVMLTGDTDEAALSADGRDAVGLPPGAEVRIAVSERRARLARLDQAGFWSMVRSKFHLPGEPAK